MNRPKIIIAGGSGFLGRSLARTLNAQEYEVVILSRTPLPEDVPARWVKWDGKTVLKPLPAFVRTLFWVYGLFIVLMIVSLGTVTLLHAPAMAQGDPVARTLAGMIAVFWGLRLIVQLFIFDASAYLTNIWLKLGDHALTVVFLFFTTIFTLVALRPGFLF